MGQMINVQKAVTAVTTETCQPFLLVQQAVWQAVSEKTEILLFNLNYHSSSSEVWVVFFGDYLVIKNRWKHGYSPWSMTLIELLKNIAFVKFRLECDSRAAWLFLAVHLQHVVNPLIPKYNNYPHIFWNSYCSTALLTPTFWHPLLKNVTYFSRKVGGRICSSFRIQQTDRVINTHRLSHKSCHSPPGLSEF